MSSTCSLKSFCSEVECVTPTGISLIAAGEIMTNCSHVGYTIKNEAELRYCVGDPLLRAICNTWKYTARLEESVKQQRDHVVVSVQHHPCK